jgi:hypothetical protein
VGENRVQFGGSNCGHRCHNALKKVAWAFKRLADKRRTGLSCRLAHLKRRPAVTDADRSEWVKTMARFRAEVTDHNRIINVDESS